MAVLWVGGAISILRDFDAAGALSAIAEQRLTCAWLAPVMLGGILAHPERHAYDVTSLRWVIGGGERTPEARIRAFTGLFTQGRYIDGFGMTETCSGDTLMEAGREIEKIGSVGRALAHVEIEIRDEAGRTLPPGEAARSACADPRSRAATGATPRRRARPSSATGCAAATSATWTRTASSISPTARRT